jgi:hypothetical protein
MDVNCTRCGDPITDGYMIGDGDGSGQRFAHPECYREYPGAYRLRDAFWAAWLDRMLIDAGREPGSMTLSEFKGRLANA